MGQTVDRFSICVFISCLSSVLVTLYSLVTARRIHYSLSLFRLNQSLSVPPSVSLTVSQFQNKTSTDADHTAPPGCWVTVSAAVATSKKPIPSPARLRQCHGNRDEEATAGTSSLSARQPLSPAPSAAGQLAWHMSTTMSQQRVDWRVKLTFCLSSFLFSSLRWGSTSQTCTRTWGMDTTWFPCWRSSLESPWYGFDLSYTHTSAQTWLFSQLL